MTRTGASQVTINEFERWAGPLKGEIARTIAENLTQLLGGASVFAYPQSANVEADYKVLVDVQRFDSAPGDAPTPNPDAMYCGVYLAAIDPPSHDDVPQLEEAFVLAPVGLPNSRVSEIAGHDV